MGPVNIGSEEMVKINELVDIAGKVSGKAVRRMHKLDAPLGVRGRNSNNDLIREKLGWDYEQTLEEGIRKTYNWIKEQIDKKKTDGSLCEIDGRTGQSNVPVRQGFECPETGTTVY